MRSNRNRSYLLCFMTFLLLIVLQAPSLWAAGPAVNAYGVETDNPYVVSRFAIEGDTRLIDKVIFPGRPPEFYRAPRAAAPKPNKAAGTNSLTKVPTFDWSYGCSATSAAMMFGYYDNNGYPNVYTGPTNGGVVPMTNAVWGTGECPLSATHMGKDGLAVRGHVDDYWIEYGSKEPDPYVGKWDEHTLGNCTGDYMGTNQSKYGNTDGSTTFYWYTNGDPLHDFTYYEPESRDGCHGMRLFFESRGYGVTDNYSQAIKGAKDTDPTKGFTWEQYKAEIDAGRPVLIQVEGHTMLGYGYNDTGSIIYLHDTWDYSSHQMTWGGSYSGMQHKGVTVFVPEAAPTKPTLTVNKSGTGAGTVTSAPTGIDCGETCSATFDKDTPVTLAASATLGSTFAGWSGACTGTGTCKVTMSADKAVGASFTLIPAGPVLTVTKSGTGAGTVTSAPAGINCGETCSATFTKNAIVTLTPTATEGSNFTGWSGACSGLGTCRVTMSAAKSVGAVFTSNPTLTVSKSGTGAGAVTSSPAGIDCGETCSGKFTRNRVVVLTPVPEPGSAFARWTGACSGAGACRVNMNGDKSVGAVFNTVTCTYLLSPQAKAFSYKYGCVNVTITSRGSTNCPVPEVTKEGDWITPSAVTLNKTRGSIIIAASANTTSLPRSGKVVVGGRVFPITQAAAPCTLTLNPTSSGTLEAAAGTYNFAITATPSDCAWTARAPAAWITLPTTSGTGSQTFSYGVKENTGRAIRNGSITVTLTKSRAAKTFSVRQARKP